MEDISLWLYRMPTHSNEQEFCTKGWLLAEELSNYVSAFVTERQYLRRNVI